MSLHLLLSTLLSTLLPTKLHFALSSADALIGSIVVSGLVLSGKI